MHDGHTQYARQRKLNGSVNAPWLGWPDIHMDERPSSRLFLKFARDRGLATTEHVVAGLEHGAHGSLGDGQMFKHTTKPADVPFAGAQFHRPLVAWGHDCSNSLPATQSRYEE